MNYSCDHSNIRLYWSVPGHSGFYSKKPSCNGFPVVSLKKGHLEGCVPPGRPVTALNRVGRHFGYSSSSHGLLGQW